jgi:hypothetical protein
MLLAPCYLMTRSALASTFGGIVTPICFAVCKFMTSSNFIGCSPDCLLSTVGFCSLDHLLANVATDRVSRLDIAAEVDPGP